MSSFSRYNPSAPPAPDPNGPRVTYSYYYPAETSSGGSGQAPHGCYYNNYYHQQQPQSYGLFPPGTSADVIRSFQMVDTNRNGYIEENELQRALSTTYRRFSLRTLRLLIFLFRNSQDFSSGIGPREFTEIWNCLSQWRAIFERFDRDRSGKMDSGELREALYSLGYALPPSVLQALISIYDGNRAELDFDNFVECGMIIKGLTEKFKEKDPYYRGSATLSYDTFMSMIIPFVASE